MFWPRTIGGFGFCMIPSRATRPRVFWQVWGGRIGGGGGWGEHLGNMWGWIGGVGAVGVLNWVPKLVYPKWGAGAETGVPKLRCPNWGAQTGVPKLGGWETSRVPYDWLTLCRKAGGVGVGVGPRAFLIQSFHCA